MVIFDWIVLALTILFIVIYGAVKTSKSSNIKSFLKDDNNTNWFTIGVSVMATQASAITFLSTPGQAYNCLLYTSPSPRDRTRSRMPSSA